MHAEGAIIEDIDNIVAEVESIMQEVIHCSLSGQNKVIIQTYSLAR